MKRVLFLLLGIVVSVGCFAWSLKGTTTEELKAGFASADYWSLPLMLTLLFAFYWLKAIRWSWLLRPVAPLTAKQLFPPMLIGFAANNLLPAHLGEFVRVFVVRRRFGVPVATVLSTVVLERIFDVLAILALFGVGLTFTDDLPDGYRRMAVIFGGVAAGVSLAVVIYLIWTDWFLKLVSRILSWFPFLPHSLTGKVTDILRTGAEGLHALRSGKTVFLVAVNSLVQWSLNGALAYVALKAFGIDVSLATGLIVTGVTALGVTIPSTPGYFGVIQVCFAVSMNAQAVKPPASLVLGSSLYYHMSMYIPVTLLGLYYLHRAGLQLKDLSSAAEHSTDADVDTAPETDNLGESSTSASPDGTLGPQ
jgi:glycosyltransferase 2 family protein